MRKVLIYDSKGYIMDSLHQWDVNQVINIDGIEIDPIPSFHFANRFSREAICVKPIIVGSRIQVQIPNELLECPETILIYAYQDTDAERDRTIFEYKIPVMPRQMPENYIFSDNMEAELIFVSQDGSVEYARQYVGDDGSGEDPVSLGDIDIPARDPEFVWEWQFFTMYSFEFSGWSTTPFGDADPNALTNVTEDRVLYAAFTVKKNRYAVPYPDLNYNGRLDDDDAKIILDAAANTGLGLPVGITSDQKIMADTNANGRITAHDAYLMRDFIDDVSKGKYENSPKGWNEFIRRSLKDREFYSVEFYNGDDAIITVVNVPSGGGCVYIGDPPAGGEGEKFLKWDPDPALITGDTRCYAKFINVEDQDNYLYGITDDDATSQTAVRYMGGNTEVKTPTQHDGIPVTSLSDGCYAGNLNITKLIFSDGVEEI